MDYGCVVIGAGVVGAAVAAALAEHVPVLLVERHGRWARETTSRNSGVVHAGLHHPAAWLKTTLCLEGRRRLERLARRHELGYRRCGKWIVATSPGEEAVLDRLARHAWRRGVEVRAAGGRELARDEPAVRGTAALLSPSSGIVDPHALTDLLVTRARDRGADLLLAHRLVGAEPIAGGYRLALRHGDEPPQTCEAERVVNAAGLEADRVAERFGVDVEAAGLAQRFACGHYLALAPRWHGAVRRLVYPVPPAGGAGLGVHLTPDAGGGLRLGPDVVWLDGRPDEASYRPDASGAGAFLEAARRYLPDLRRDDLAPAYVGCRPRLSGPGEPPRDFHVEEACALGRPGLVNLIGIDSPGLTAAPAIGAHVARLYGFAPTEEV